MILPSSSGILVVLATAPGISLKKEPFKVNDTALDCKPTLKSHLVLFHLVAIENFSKIHIDPQAYRNQVGEKQNKPEKDGIPQPIKTFQSSQDQRKANCGEKEQLAMIEISL